MTSLPRAWSSHRSAEHFQMQAHAKHNAFSTIQPYSYKLAACTVVLAYWYVFWKRPPSSYIYRNLLTSLRRRRSIHGSAENFQKQAHDKNNSFSTIQLLLVVGFHLVFQLNTNTVRSCNASRTAPNTSTIWYYARDQWESFDIDVHLRDNASTFLVWFAFISQKMAHIAL